MLRTLQKMNLKVALGVAACAVLVAGCGSNSSSTDTPSPLPPPPVASTDIGADVSALFAYLEKLIGTDGNSDGADVNALTLVQDDQSEPAAVTF